MQESFSEYNEASSALRVCSEQQSAAVDPQNTFYTCIVLYIGYIKKGTLTYLLSLPHDLAQILVCHSIYTSVVFSSVSLCLSVSEFLAISMGFCLNANC